MGFLDNLLGKKKKDPVPAGNKTAKAGESGGSGEKKDEQCQFFQTGLLF